MNGHMLNGHNDYDWFTLFYYVLILLKSTKRIDWFGDKFKEKRKKQNNITQ